MTDQPRDVFGGVDTHADTHHAAVVDALGRHLADAQFPTTSEGYHALLTWLRSHGNVRAVGVEGTGSYGTQLARVLTAAGLTVFDINRPDRRIRHRQGKSDPIDAYAAAQAVAAGRADIVPKAHDGAAESLRVLHNARTSAVKARTQAINQIRSLLVTAPDTLRAQLRGLAAADLIATCSRLRPSGDLATPAAAAKFTLRRLARRSQELGREVEHYDSELTSLATQAAPELVSVNGVGPVTAARMLAAVGDNPERLRSEAAFAHLCGVAPIPASSGRRDRHRLNRGGNRSANLRLIEFLREKQVLLVLDNCEHLVEACAELAAALLPACPGVRVLATSREVLDIAGERVFLVSPLPVPAAESLQHARADSELDAVTLFAERASAAVPGFALTPDNQSAVAGLCRRLDGLPLAIELAAVRLRVLTVEQLLARQDERHEILATKRRGSSPRHHSLRAMVDWSFELCTDQEQLLWARMSVFAGGCDLQALEDVCAGSDLTPDAVLDALTGLVEKSIAIREDHGGADRYRMLETLRQYGLEHLRSDGGEARVRRNHRDHYLRLADRIEQQWFGPDQATLFGSAREEHANLRAAMEYSLTTPGQAAIHMAAALYSYWVTCGLLQEGFHWLERALDCDPHRGLPRAEALWATGFLTLIGGNPKVLAKSPSRRTDDIAIKGGEMHVAISMLEESLGIATELNSQDWIAHATFTLGFGILVGSQDPSGFFMLTDGIELERKLGSANPRLCFAQYMLVEALTLGEMTAQAIPIGEECLATCRAQGDTWLQSWVHLFLGLARWIQQQYAEASAHLEECIRLKQPFRELLGIGAAMEFLSWCAVAVGDAERGARLSGAVPAVLKPLGTPPASFAPILRWREKVVLQAIAVLGESTYEEIYNGSAHLGAEDAIAYALGTTGPHPVEHAPDIAGPLTAREEQVAEMIADGLSNKEISERLVISQRTAETHAANILKKLGYASRAQVAVWITERRHAN